MDEPRGVTKVYNDTCTIASHIIERVVECTSDTTHNGDHHPLLARRPVPGVDRIVSPVVLGIF